MPIKSFTPRTIKRKDLRRPEGGYYTAECDECGGTFYPLRADAKFCSDYCSSRYYHRKYRAEGRYKYKKGGVTPDKDKTLSVKEVEELFETYSSTDKLYERLSDHDTFGDKALYRCKGEFKKWLMQLEVGTADCYPDAEGWVIQKLSPRKWSVLDLDS